MAQYSPKTWVTGEPITAAELNAIEAAAAAAAVKADTDAAIAAASTADRARANHTGTQAASTVTGLATVATSGAYTDLSGKPTIPAAYTDAQAVAANASAIAGKAPQLAPTATKTAAYTATVGDLAVMNVAGGATALTLPTAPADRSTVGFLAIGATAAAPLTVNRGGTDTIGPAAATTVTAPLSNEATVYQYDAANTRWLAVSNVKPLAALDGRYPLSSTLGATVTADPAVKAALAPRDMSSVVFLGDSYTDRSFYTVATNFAAYQDDGYLNWAMTNLGQRARIAGILGYVGQNTDVILSHVGDAIATGAGVLVEEGGINDVNAGNIAAATIQANKLAIWQAALNAGMRVVATTIPPRGSYTGTQKATLYAVNAWIRKQAGLMRGVTVCDWAPALADPATGNALTGMLRSDGVHPTPMGAMRLGARLATALGTILPPLDVMGSGGDPTNILTNGGMTGNTSGVATSWTFSNLAQGAATATASKVARTDDIPGEWQQINVASGNTTGFQLYQVVGPSASTWAIGNTISALLEFQRDNDWTAFPDTPASLRLRIQFTGSNRYTYGNNHVSPDPGWTAAMPMSGVLRTPPLVIPTGSTNAIFGLEFAGQGTIRIGRCRMHVGQDASGYTV